ncbi:MAG: DUF4890 domain-containing protein [Lunatimonas sp.]|uniref:DUF4890 domain-containing protein n=1 Tax=Lunatimonas sp. TaxID=2060141 RepID=UPI00263B5E67|nr:DUF4890 domain-containing protein [Lunatimonas sp.]MCC5937288.1 DUF4890 domain-containing protein [Lunatimonas sp.]
MKKVLIIYALSLGFIVQSYAQQGNRPERTPEKMAERMASQLAEKLELQDAQKQQVYEIQLQHATARKQRMEEMRKEMQANREAHQGQISAVLTPQQREKWEEMMQQRKDRADAWRDRGGDRRGGQPMHRKRGVENGPRRGGPRGNS